MILSVCCFIKQLNKMNENKQSQICNFEILKKKIIKKTNL